MSIKTNLKDLLSAIPDDVMLVAVSKTKPISDLMQAYEAGQRVFGENKIQEMTMKYDIMPKDIKWHMIGHVQTNKVKHMASYVDLIHGVDNFKLLKEINKQAKKQQRIINCLLQIKIADEDTKFGLSNHDAMEIVRSDAFLELKNIKVCGLMGMASHTKDQNKIKKEFNYLKAVFDDLKSIKRLHYDLQIMSMGMSNDYKLALSCGSNMIRIGSHIFGVRN